MTFSYDNLDRPTKVTYPDGTFEQAVWVNLDPVSLRDRLGQWTQQQFDSMDQLVKATDPLGRSTQFHWCTCGALGSMTDPAGNLTQWTRDLQGRVAQKIYPDNSTETNTFDLDTGRLASVVCAGGSSSKTKSYTYNTDNTLYQVSYSDSNTSQVTYGYDPNYPRITSVANGWGTVSYAYNAYITDPYGTPVTGAGRVSQISDRLAGAGSDQADITFSYDPLGRMLNRSINGTANSTTLTFDAMSRVTSIVNPLGSFTPAYVDQGSGDKGTTRLASMTYPNGQVTNYSYYSSTGDERLQEIQNLNSSSGVISQFDYGYDAKGEITSWKQQADSNAATRYDIGYDAAGQLSSDVLKTDSTNAVLKQYYYNYDAASNRTSEQIDGAVTTSGANNLNQLTGQSAGGATRFAGTISQPGTVTVNGQPAQMPSSTNFVANPVLSSGTNTVAVVAANGGGNAATNNYQVVVSGSTAGTPTYDAFGNMTNNGNGQTYTWDDENRLLSISQGGNTYAFAYDGLGRRVSETDNGTLTKQWTWVGAQVAEENDGSGTVQKRFYPQGEQIGGSPYFYTKDHLGSVREMTDSSGTIQARYDYDPYGRVTKISGSMDSDFQYAGYYEHAASGLNLTLFRAYDPNTGKWLSRDPAGEDHGVNLYAYVDNGPIDGIDPLGLWEVTITAADGFGGQLSFGYNNGHANVGVSGGVGLGGGIQIDPSTNCDNNNWDAGLTAQGNIGLSGVGSVGATASYDDQSSAPFGLAPDEDSYSYGASATFNNFGVLPTILPQVDVGKQVTTPLGNGWSPPSGSTCITNTGSGDLSNPGEKPVKPLKATADAFAGVHFNVLLW